MDSITFLMVRAQMGEIIRGLLHELLPENTMPEESFNALVSLVRMWWGDKSATYIEQHTEVQDDKWFFVPGPADLEKIEKLMEG